MKLLYDANLSPRLVDRLADLASDDLRIWQYAASTGFVIVSKDSDFHQLSFLRGHPP